MESEAVLFNNGRAISHGSFVRTRSCVYESVRISLPACSFFFSAVFSQKKKRKAKKEHVIYFWVKNGSKCRGAGTSSSYYVWPFRLPSPWFLRRNKNHSFIHCMTVYGFINKRGVLEREISPSSTMPYYIPRGTAARRHRFH